MTTTQTEILFERWAPVAGYNGVYEVSSYGRLRRNKTIVRGRVLPPGMLTGHTRKNGYIVIQLPRLTSVQTDTINARCSRAMYLHRIVAEAFLPNPDNLPQVNHIDSNPSNCAVENLEWVTGKNNLLHALIATGRRLKQSACKCKTLMAEVDLLNAKLIGADALNKKRSKNWSLVACEKTLKITAGNKVIDVSIGIYHDTETVGHRAINP